MTTTISVIIDPSQKPRDWHIAYVFVDDHYNTQWRQYDYQGYAEFDFDDAYQEVERNGSALVGSGND